MSCESSYIRVIFLLQKNAHKELNLLVPLDYTNRRMVGLALKILEEYQQLHQNETKASAGYVHVVGKLTRVLSTSVNLVKTSADLRTVWNKISQVCMCSGVTEQ